MSSDVRPPPSLPEGFVCRLEDALGDERAREVMTRLRSRPAPCFRVNRLKAERDGPVLDELLQLGVAARALEGAEGVYVTTAEHREALTHSALAGDGRVLVMNPASVLPVLALDPRPGERVLDLCAAPGGKTLLLAEKMGLEGELSAVEKVRPRFFKLKGTLERAGAGRFVRTFLMDGALVAKKVPARFDRALVDAPCSSEARICLDEPESFAHWRERKVSEMARKQRRLLLAAAKAVKPGGTIVYSTCSYSPEENEGVLDFVLSKSDGELSLEELALPFGTTLPGLRGFRGDTFVDEVTKARRVLPDGVLHGFFVARLRRRR